MWMSFMTSGVKILDEPSMYFLLSAGARDKAASPVDVRSTPPLPFVLVSATARGLAFVLAFTEADFALVFLAALLAITVPRHYSSSRRKPGSIDSIPCAQCFQACRLRDPGFRRGDGIN